MRDGTFIVELDIKKGELKDYSCYINPGIDKFYRRMFIKAKKAVERNSENIENGIKLIIFGCFYIESLCNELYKNVLFLNISNKKLSQAMWNGTKKMNIKEKFNLTFEAVTEKLEFQNEYLKNIQTIFNLRNRLAHFKDDNIECTDYIKPDNNINITQKGFLDEDTFKKLNIPEPELIRELKGKKIEQHIERLEKLEKWTNTISRIVTGYEKINLNLKDIEKRFKRKKE